MRKKLSAFVAPLVASAGLMMGGTARASETPESAPKTPAITQKAESRVVNPSDFKGKSFEERTKKAEEIVQRYNLEHGTHFSDVFEILLKEAKRVGTFKGTHIGAYKVEDFLGPGEHAMIDPKEILDQLELVRLGQPLSQVDASLPYADQLEVCGFDLLAKIARGKVSMKSLSQEDRALAYAQYEAAETLSRERVGSDLLRKMKKEDKGADYPYEKSKESINGHRMDGENLYIANVAKQVQKKIAAEKVLYKQSQAER